MGKAKMYKINSVAAFPNVFQNPHYTQPVLLNCRQEPLKLKGKWRELVFQNNNPLVLELACGKGDYTIALATLYPNVNFVGVDIKGARIYTGARYALENSLRNAAFARFRIENILHFFSPREVNEIWITFPDPFPRKSDAKHRLTAPGFLARYREILSPGGIIHLKTDDANLFRFSCETALEAGAVIQYCKEDIHSSPPDFPELSILTFYEKQHIANGRKIHYLRFTFPQ